MARTPAVVVARSGGGSAAGLLLMLAAIVGLVALFSGNLDRFVVAIAGSAGGPEGLHRTTAPASWTADQPRPGAWGEVAPIGRQPSATGDPGRGGARPT